MDEDGEDDEDEEAAAIAAAIALSAQEGGGDGDGDGDDGDGDDQMEDGGDDDDDSDDDEAAMAAALALSTAEAGAGAGAGTGAAPAAAAAVPPAAPAAGGGTLTAADLQAAFLGITQAAQAASRRTMLEVGDVVRGAGPACVDALLGDPAVRAALRPLLPDGRQTDAELELTLRGGGGDPRIRQAMRALTGALHSDSFNMIMANFRLDPRAGMAALAAGDPVEAFLRAVQAAVDAAPAPEDGAAPAPAAEGGDEGTK